MLGLFFGSDLRNARLMLENPRPIARQKNSIDSGNAGLDGFSALSKANPDEAGHRPSVPGGARPTYWRSGNSFEQ